LNWSCFSGFGFSFGGIFFFIVLKPGIIRIFFFQPFSEGLSCLFISGLIQPVLNLIKLFIMKLHGHFILSFIKSISFNRLGLFYFFICCNNDLSNFFVLFCLISFKLVVVGVILFYEGKIVFLYFFRSCFLFIFYT
jgi:hypothetical protein